ncbi:hypothetical protein [Tahibacter soli]|jgi:hypothetical protein|uniref:Uncharacterized protein n=1 Tax=Tahibacter soli TaxID=2983605 RepID=A0A9X3YQE6_9GAMM|nr:hypothetical protein [Tahibacter soli]MDC8016007.1 hypothetical protein [Tahibacter soli]
MKSLSYALSLKRILGFAAVSAAAALAAPLAQAQNFESYYGERPTSDAGQDIKSVNFCPTGGSILVGTRRNGNVTEAQVTRVDNNGVALWQNAYRVAGNAFTTANAVVEVFNAGGFAITGAVGIGAQSIYVLRIRCDGSPLWATVLRNQSTLNRATGWDIIESRNPTSPTIAPELVVVGEEVLPNAIGTTHGRIARLNAAGGLLWSRAYIRAGTLPGLRFRAVTENLNLAGANTDLVIAGSAAAGANWANDRRGLIFRTTGAGAPVCNNTLGRVDPVNEDFYGITALRQPQFNGNNVLVGSTSVNATGAIGEQVYMARFATGNCLAQRQSVWRDPQDNSVAYDVVEEILTTLPVVIGVRATGTISGAVTAGDGFLLDADPGALGPINAQFRYSTQSARHENLQAIDNKKDRFVMLGATQTDWDGVGDPLDFYMVQTDPNGKTQCVRDWQVDWSPVEQPQERFDQTIKEMPASSVDVLVTPTKDEGYCCQLDPN